LNIRKGLVFAALIGCSGKREKSRRPSRLHRKSSRNLSLFSRGLHINRAAIGRARDFEMEFVEVTVTPEMMTAACAALEKMDRNK
jgi:hypothetical protein